MMALMQTTQSAIADGRFVAYQVRFQLKRQKRSQAWLAREFGKPRDWMSRRVRGDVAFDVEEIQKVAEILGIEVACFFPPARPQARAS